MKPRIIGLYLPQYHPIPENDEWWGKGFTEWTNVAKARPLFRGHYQPRIPADLGFYDLRLPEVREQQAELAREAGLEGFCYYYYWFGNGRQLLERPFNEVLDSGKPDFPFCLCWANHDWTNKTWTRGTSLRRDSMIMQMHYDREDYVRHFHYALKAFRDPRYITVDSKPLFAVWAPRDIPDARQFIDTWQQLALENGLAGIHFVGYTQNASSHATKSGKRLWDAQQSAERYQEVLDMGFDAVISSGLGRAQTIVKGKWRKALFVTFYKKLPFSLRTDYAKAMKHYYVEEDSWENVYPTLMPQWDRTPRDARNSDPLTNSTPEKFQTTVEEALHLIANKEPEHQILFLKAWNEWGEGNYVEPDLKFGHGYLNAIRNALAKQIGL